ncbi:hypothetical protein AcV7_008947, partial [Taiwanofungus camphoratus]
MALTTKGLSALLHALSLAQGLYKPIPGVAALTSNTLRDVSSATEIYPTDGTVPAQSSNNGNADNYQAQPVASLQTGYINAQGVPCGIQSYEAPSLGDQTFPPFDQAEANVYRYRQQQSVNLGSWFVHEQWMTPSVFTCASGKQISELDIASGWGATVSARAVLEQHWDTFINQTDFEYLASIGINTVRLPIGYWSLGPDFCQGTPFAPVAEVYQNSWARVARAINMAGEAGIGVLVDLHGAPGSQNGQPHSGISDGTVNLFSDPSNVDKTIAILTFLMEQLVNVTNVVGIQMLNEPADVPELPDF